MLELDQNEINEVSGGRTIKEIGKKASWVAAAVEFAEGFWAGVKAGYQA